MDLMYKARKAHYLNQLNISVQHMLTMLNNIKQRPGVSIDDQLRAIDLCIQHLPNVKRALLYIKNTENPTPTGGGNGPSNNSA